MTSRRLLPAEHGRPSSGGSRVRPTFASDTSVVNPDVHVTCDDSQNVIIIACFLLR